MTSSGSGQLWSPASRRKRPGRSPFGRDAGKPLIALHAFDIPFRYVVFDPA